MGLPLPLISLRLERTTQQAQLMSQFMVAITSQWLHQEIVTGGITSALLFMLLLLATSTFQAALLKAHMDLFLVTPMLIKICAFQAALLMVPNKLF